MKLSITEKQKYKGEELTRRSTWLQSMKNINMLDPATRFSNEKHCRVEANMVQILVIQQL